MTENKIAFSCLPFYYLFHGSEFHKLYLLHLPIGRSQNRNLQREMKEEEEQC